MHQFPHLNQKQIKNTVAVIDFANITRDMAVHWLSGGIAETVTVELKKYQRSESPAAKRC